MGLLTKISTRDNTEKHQKLSTPDLPTCEKCRHLIYQEYDAHIVRVRRPGTTKTAPLGTLSRRIWAIKERFLTAPESSIRY